MTASVILNLLQRQERTVCSRLGAGISLERAFQWDRWVREVKADLGLADEDASVLVASIAAALSGTVDRVQSREQQPAAARLAFADLRARANVLVPSGIPGQTGDQFLYQLYDVAGTLLYIGISDRGPVRLVEHYRKKPWFSQVARVEFERYETRDEVEEREKFLIGVRAPRYNIQHNRGRQAA